MFSQSARFSTSPTRASRKPSATSKRNVYDTTMRRNDAEKSVLRKKKVGAGAIKKSLSGPLPAVKAVKAAAAAGNLKKGDYACKHDEELKADHLAKGGKLSDLPTPPPQCPHCSHMLHSKPDSTAKMTRSWK